MVHVGVCGPHTPTCTPGTAGSLEYHTIVFCCMGFGDREGNGREEYIHVNTDTVWCVYFRHVH